MTVGSETGPSPEASPGETGTPADSGSDATTNEASAPEAGADAGPLDATAPALSPLVTGTNLQVWGVTADGHIVYSDETAGTLFQVPVAGGTPKTVAALGAGTHSVVVKQNVSFLWTAIDATGVGTLSLFASTAASPTQVSMKSWSGKAEVTADSSHVVYFDNANGTAKSGDLFLATSAGASPVSLLTATDLSGAAQCNFAMKPAASAWFVVSHCEPHAGEAGVALAFLSEFDASTGQRADLFSTTRTFDPTSGFALSPSGAQLLVYWADRGGVTLFTLASPSTPTTIDASGFDPVAFSPDGLRAIYVWVGGCIGSCASGVAWSPVTNPAPVNGGSLKTYFALEPDGANVIGYENSGAKGTDLFLVSTTNPLGFVSVEGPVAGTLPPALGRLPKSGAFTSDSSHVLFVDNAGAAPALTAFSIAGTASRVLASNPASVYATGASSSVIVFSASALAGARSAGDGTADLFTVDTATTAAPTLVANQANVDYALTPARDKVVFVWDGAVAAKAGLYVAPVP